MKKHFVLDSTVFLTYSSYNKVSRLIYASNHYGLTIYINQELLAELKRNLPKVIKVSGLSPDDVLLNILNFTTFVETQKKFTNSPDPKDNFLFDLALQTQREVIVTQEKMLLSFGESPVPIHDLKWFKETYPVPL